MSEDHADSRNFPIDLLRAAHSMRHLAFAEKGECMTQLKPRRLWLFVSAIVATLSASAPMAHGSGATLTDDAFVQAHSNQSHGTGFVEVKGTKMDTETGFIRFSLNLWVPGYPGSAR